MSAAKAQPIFPLSQEALRFWDELIAECRRQLHDFNRAAKVQGAANEDLVQLDTGSGLVLEKTAQPSTRVEAALRFEPWGPAIRGSVCGEQRSGKRIPTVELEIPIGSDLDGSVVAIFDEGRSFTPADLTRYFLQIFRRCYPVSLLRY